MSVGNLKDNGNKGNNFPWQLAVLQLLGTISTNTAGAGADHEFRITNYKATATLGGCYTIGDFISRTDIILTSTGAIVSTLWFNETTGLALVGACIPPIGNLAPFIPPGTVTLSSTARVPSLTRAVIAGVVAAGAQSVSVYNAGTTDGIWLGAAIKPGEQFTYGVNGNDTLGAFAYTASATAELVITVII